MRLGKCEICGRETKGEEFEDQLFPLGGKWVCGWCWKEEAEER